jgi:hypothetical protein
MSVTARRLCVGGSEAVTTRCLCVGGSAPVTARCFGGSAAVTARCLFSDSGLSENGAIMGKRECLEASVQMPKCDPNTIYMLSWD